VFLEQEKRPGRWPQVPQIPITYKGLAYEKPAASIQVAHAEHAQNKAEPEAAAD